MQTHRLVQTVVNYTGVESHHVGHPVKTSPDLQVTAFRLVPSPDMSEEQAQQGINKAIAMLSQASQAKTKIVCGLKSARTGANKRQDGIRVDHGHQLVQLQPQHVSRSSLGDHG